jgi:hypothetical protein
MKTLTSLAAIVLLGSCLFLSPRAQPASRMLAHDVYFTLKDDSEAAKDQLVVACKTHLSDHPGTVWFDAGVPVAEHDRGVNDRDFDVALHLLFKDKASHDQYQEAPKHRQFIDENQANWEKVRVFDSWIVTTAHPDTD